MKFKELLKEDETYDDIYYRYQNDLESLRFRKQEAIKKVKEDWDKKIEQVKKEYFQKRHSKNE